MNMASETQVKRYLAYWFQLGKRLILPNGEKILPHPIMTDDRYSEDFEKYWQIILTEKTGESYLEGTTQSIKELLTPRWVINPCSRCDMPVPVLDLGQQSSLCPCNDMLDWPNTELPAPRDPVKTHDRLHSIIGKLRNINN